MCLEQSYLLSAVLAMIGALCQSQARGIHFIIGQTSLMIMDSISRKLRKWPAPVAVRRNHSAWAVAVHSGFCLPGRHSRSLSRNGSSAKITNQPMANLQPHLHELA